MLSVSLTNLGGYECIACPPNSASSINRSTCITCPNGIDTNGTVTGVAGECLCPTGSAIIEKDTLGQYLTTKQCIQCLNNTYPGIPAYNCQACGYGKIYSTTKAGQCVCNTSYVAAGNDCILSTDAQLVTNQNDNSLTISNVETLQINSDSSLSVNADIITFYYILVGYNCLTQSNITACEILANLCVLEMYKTSSPPCQLYISINNARSQVANGVDANQRINMPWLYYKSEAPQVINNTQKIGFQVSFDFNDTINVNQFQYYVAKYNINGTFLGMDPLTTEFEFCSKSYDDGVRYRSFGNTIIQNCYINLAQYLLRNYTMIFYELYLFDPVQQIYIDIPIMIDNIENPLSTDTSTRMNNSSDPINWILVRRFFTIDNLSGIKSVGGYIGGQTADIIRFPKLFKFITMLQTTSQPKIMVPYVEIFYKARQADILAVAPNTFITFTSEFRMDISGFNNTAKGIFIALNFIVLTFVIMRMYIWYKLNPPQLSPDNYCIWFCWNGVIRLFGYWGTNNVLVSLDYIRLLVYIF